MSEQDKPMSKGSQGSPSISESSSTPSSSEERRRPYLSTASDGRVTLIFPFSGAWNAQYQAPSPQPARYEPVTPASEFSLREGNQADHEKTAPLRLMTDESLTTVLDSSDAELKAHSNPGAGDLEAWIESSRQTITRQNSQEKPARGGDKS